MMATKTKTTMAADPNMRRTRHAGPDFQSCQTLRERPVSESTRKRQRSGLSWTNRCVEIDWWFAGSRRWIVRSRPITLLCGLVLLHRPLGIRQQELRPSWEVLDIVAEVVRRRQGLATHRGLASHQGTHQQTTGQKSERPEVMFREVHSVAHRSRMTVAVPMRDAPRGQSLGVSSSCGGGIFRKIGKTRKIDPAGSTAYARTTAAIPWPPPTQSAAAERFTVPEATL